MDNNDDDDNDIYNPELTAEENQIKFLFKTFFSQLAFTNILTTCSLCYILFTIASFIF